MAGQVTLNGLTEREKMFLATRHRNRGADDVRGPITEEIERRNENACQIRGSRGRLKCIRPTRTTFRSLSESGEALVPKLDPMIAGSEAARHPICNGTRVKPGVRQRASGIGDGGKRRPSRLSLSLA
jgi:hypothetical protein